MQALATALFAFTALFPLANFVSAECGALDPWTPFQTIAPVAATVVLGEVVADRDPSSDGYLKKFAIRVDRVFRGAVISGSVLEIAYLRPGPPGRCPDTYLRPLLGDVLAIAIDARNPDGLSFNSAVWLKGSPDEMQQGLGTTTLAKLEALLGLPPTDTVPAPARDQRSAGWSLLDTLIGVMTFLVFTHIRGTLRKQKGE
jgi:hypothetical protein